MQKLQIGGNGRHLAKADGTPFIWIGDTLWRWELYTDEELDEYVAKRAAQGFTIVQIRLLSEKAANGVPFLGAEGMATPYMKGPPGGRPFDMSKLQPNEAYWARVDRFLAKLAAAGLYAAPVITWGQPHELRYASAQALHALARYVGQRYRDFDGLVWLTLGEATHPGSPKETVMAAVNGLREGDTGGKLLSLHANNRMTTAARYWDELDFHTWQTSQWCAPRYLPSDDWQSESTCGTWAVWEALAADCARTPPKPVLDAEAWYEDAPLDPVPRYPSYTSHFGVFGQGHGSQAYHVRRRAYFTVFGGACGHTYGAEPVWTHGRLFLKDLQAPGNAQTVTWRAGLEFPGGRQMGHMRKLLESHAFDRLVPDPSLIRVGQSDEYDSHVQTARASDGSYAYAYVADGHPIGLDTTKLADSVRSAGWFNPRTGETTDIGPFERGERTRFDPPGSPGIDNDWVLVLDG
ncbi:MAG: glycoside hydrolase family 140 protein [Kiritimatiellae bacterium]|nr:glycoside hydrolase family 140 protein [Kiritimatiellia bacterium]